MQSPKGAFQDQGNLSSSRGFMSVGGTPSKPLLTAQRKNTDQPISTGRGPEDANAKPELRDISPRVDYDALDNGIVTTRAEPERSLAAQIKQALMPQSSRNANAKIPIEDRLLKKNAEREVDL